MPFVNNIHLNLDKNQSFEHDNTNSAYGSLVSSYQSASNMLPNPENSSQNPTVLLSPNFTNSQLYSRLQSLMKFKDNVYLKTQLDTTTTLFSMNNDWTKNISGEDTQKIIPKIYNEVIVPIGKESQTLYKWEESEQELKERKEHLDDKRFGNSLATMRERREESIRSNERQKLKSNMQGGEQMDLVSSARNNAGENHRKRTSELDWGIQPAIKRQSNGASSSIQPRDGLANNKLQSMVQRGNQINDDNRHNPGPSVEKKNKIYDDEQHDATTTPNNCSWNIQSIQSSLEMLKNSHSNYEGQAEINATPVKTISGEEIQKITYKCYNEVATTAVNSCEDEPNFDETLPIDEASNDIGSQESEDREREASINEGEKLNSITEGGGEQMAMFRNLASRNNAIWEGYNIRKALNIPIKIQKPPEGLLFLLRESLGKVNTLDGYLNWSDEYLKPMLSIPFIRRQITEPKQSLSGNTRKDADMKKRENDAHEALENYRIRSESQDDPIVIQLKKKYQICVEKRRNAVQKRKNYEEKKQEKRRVYETMKNAEYRTESLIELAKEKMDQHQFDGLLSDILALERYIKSSIFLPLETEGSKDKEMSNVTKFRNLEKQYFAACKEETRIFETFIQIIEKTLNICGRKGKSHENETDSLPSGNYNYLSDILKRRETETLETRTFPFGNSEKFGESSLNTLNQPALLHPNLHNRLAEVGMTTPFEIVDHTAKKPQNRPGRPRSNLEELIKDKEKLISELQISEKVFPIKKRHEIRVQIEEAKKDVKRSKNALSKRKWYEKNKKSQKDGALLKEKQEIVDQDTQNVKESLMKEAKESDQLNVFPQMEQMNTNVTPKINSNAMKQLVKDLAMQSNQFLNLQQQMVGLDTETGEATIIEPYRLPINENKNKYFDKRMNMQENYIKILPQNQPNLQESTIFRTVSKIKINQ